MKTVWKFKLQLSDVQNVEMPTNAQILCVQVQPWEGGEDVCLWALVDPEQPLTTRKILIVGTGHDREDLAQPFLHYIGTFQVAGGRLVFHVFENLYDRVIEQIAEPLEGSVAPFVVG